MFVLHQKNKSIIVISVVLSISVFISCKKTASVNSDDESSMKVSVIQVEQDKYDEDLNSFGSVTYNVKNNVTCLQPGILERIAVKDGNKVYKGQFIAQLKNIQLEFQREQYRNAVETANATLAIKKNSLREAELSVESKLMTLEKSDLAIEQKEIELELESETLRNKMELNELGGVTDSTLKELKIKEKSSKAQIAIMKKEREIASLGLRDEDLILAGYVIPSDKNERKKMLIDLNTKDIKTQIAACEAEVRNAETSLNAVNKLIEALTITAPITGIVGGKQYEVGEYIEANKNLLTIMDTSSVYAVIYIQEKDMVNYSLGSKVIIEVPSLNKVIETKISEISPIADAQSGNFSIKAKLPNKDNQIKPGMFITCSIKKNDVQELCKIPESALVAKTENTGIVFCIRNQFVFQEKISIKSIKDGYAWIAEGLNKDDLIIDSPSPFLKEGQSVKW